MKGFKAWNKLTELARDTQFFLLEAIRIQNAPKIWTSQKHELKKKCILPVLIILHISKKRT